MEDEKVSKLYDAFDENEANQILIYYNDKITTIKSQIETLEGMSRTKLFSSQETRITRDDSVSSSDLDDDDNRHRVSVSTDWSVSTIDESNRNNQNILPNRSLTFENLNDLDNQNNNLSSTSQKKISLKIEIPDEKHEYESTDSSLGSNIPNDTHIMDKVVTESMLSELMLKIYSNSSNIINNIKANEMISLRRNLLDVVSTGIVEGDLKSKITEEIVKKYQNAYMRNRNYNDQSFKDELSDRLGRIYRRYYRQNDIPITDFVHRESSVSSSKTVIQKNLIEDLNHNFKSYERGVINRYYNNPSTDNYKKILQELNRYLKSYVNYPDIISKLNDLRLNIFNNHAQLEKSTVLLDTTKNNSYDTNDINILQINKNFKTRARSVDLGIKEYDDVNPNLLELKRSKIPRMNTINNESNNPLKKIKNLTLNNNIIRRNIQNVVNNYIKNKDLSSAKVYLERMVSNYPNNIELQNEIANMRFVLSQTKNYVNLPLTILKEIQTQPKLKEVPAHQRAKSTLASGEVIFVDQEDYDDQNKLSALSEKDYQIFPLSENSNLKKVKLEVKEIEFDFDKLNPREKYEYALKNNYPSETVSEYKLKYFIWKNKTKLFKPRFYGAQYRFNINNEQNIDNKQNKENGEKIEADQEFPWFLANGDLNTNYVWRRHHVVRNRRWHVVRDYTGLNFDKDNFYDKIWEPHIEVQPFIYDDPETLNRIKQQMKQYHYTPDYENGYLKRTPFSQLVSVTDEQKANKILVNKELSPIPYTEKMRLSNGELNPDYIWKRRKLVYDSWFVINDDKYKIQKDKYYVNKEKRQHGVAEPVYHYMIDTDCGYLVRTPNSKINKSAWLFTQDPSPELSTKDSAVNLMNNKPIRTPELPKEKLPTSKGMLVDTDTFQKIYNNIKSKYHKIVKHPDKVSEYVDYYLYNDKDLQNNLNKKSTGIKVNLKDYKNLTIDEMLMKFNGTYDENYLNTNDPRKISEFYGALRELRKYIDKRLNKQLK